MDGGSSHGDTETVESRFVRVIVTRNGRGDRSANGRVFNVYRFADEAATSAGESHAAEDLGRPRLDSSDFLKVLAIKRRRNSQRKNKCN